MILFCEIILHCLHCRNAKIEKNCPSKNLIFKNISLLLQKISKQCKSQKTTKMSTSKITSSKGENKRRYECSQESILMLHKRFSVVQVSDSLGIDWSTLYCQTYKSGGISELIDNNKGYWGMLSGIQLSQLRIELKCRVYTDAKSVSLWIKQTFHVDYTPQGVVERRASYPQFTFCLCMDRKGRRI